MGLTNVTGAHPVDDALGVQRGERGDDAGGAPARLLLAQPPLPVQPRQQLPACGTSILLTVEIRCWSRAGKHSACAPPRLAAAPPGPATPAVPGAPDHFSTSEASAVKSEWLHASAEPCLAEPCAAAT